MRAATVFLVACGGAVVPDVLDGTGGFEVARAVAVVCPTENLGRQYLVVTIEGTGSKEGCDMDGAGSVPVTCERRLAYAAGSQVCDGAPAVVGDGLPMVDQYLLLDPETGLWDDVGSVRTITCEDGVETAGMLYGDTVVEEVDGQLVLTYDLGATEGATGALSGTVVVEVCE